MIPWTHFQLIFTLIALLMTSINLTLHSELRSWNLRALMHTFLPCFLWTAYHLTLVDRPIPCSLSEICHCICGDHFQHHPHNHSFPWLDKNLIFVPSRLYVFRLVVFLVFYHYHYRYVFFSFWLLAPRRFSRTIRGRSGVVYLHFVTLHTIFASSSLSRT